MKFKKQIFAEEIGLPKSNRKTFTTGQKQKIVVSEQQLQRLISKVTNSQRRNGRRLNENRQLLNEFWWVTALMLAWDIYKFGKDEDWWMVVPPDETEEEFNDFMVANPDVFGDGPKPKSHREFVSLRDKALREKKRGGGNQKGERKPMKESKQMINELLWLSILASAWALYKMGHGAGWWGMQAPGTNEEEYQDFLRDNPSVFEKHPEPRNFKDFIRQVKQAGIDVGRGKRKQEMGEDNSSSTSTTSPKKKKCCKCVGKKPYSVVPGKSCPKSCPEVPCKGTPPTNAVGLSERDGKGMNKQKGKFDTPKNMKACKGAGGSESLCAKHLRSGTMPPKPSGTPQGKWILGGFFCCAFDRPCCEGSPIDTIRGMFEESRTLKTTNPITESDIKDMKKWFNRVNKSGRGYNPSIIR